MRIILDTGTLFRRDVLLRLVDDPRAVVLPAVALAERLRQLRRDDRDVHRWMDVLQAWRIEVEPFGPDEALRLLGLPAVADDRRWRRLARDALIAAHVRPADEVWTTNPKDFLEVGLDPVRIMAV